VHKPSCFSTKINLSLKDKLRADLISQGFDLTQPAHTIFSAKKPGISCTLYESGSLTVQGKEMGPFIEFYLEPEILQTFGFSNPDVGLDLSPHIGMDEAGKGDFFGPLCIAAVFADKEGILQLREMGVKDSKRFSDETIGKLAHKIKNAYPHTIIRLFPAKYNELYAKFKNLNRLLAWAHTAALQELTQRTGCTHAILDQFADPSLVESFMQQKKLTVKLTQKVRGEEDLVVAAASILARDGFVSGIDQLSQEFGLILPKGASSAVIAAAKQFAGKFGREALAKVGKTHFKTMEQIGSC
jgi:ribonuclease HIII